MALREYVAAIRQSWWILLLAVLLGGAVGVVVVVASPPQYSSTVAYFVGTPDTDSSALQGDQFGQQRVTTYARLLNTESVAKRVITDTGLDLTPAELSTKISGAADLDTVLVTATVIDESKERSLQIAKSLSVQFVNLVNDLETKSDTRPAPAYLVVVSGPTLNPTAISPRPELDISLGLVVGLIVGIALALLRKLSDSTIRSTETLRAIASPVLGTIAFDRAAKAAPLINETQSQSVRAEAVRQLRTNLRFVDVASPARVIVVTSSVPSEGKSTTATNLAIAFAESEQRVLLIEADLRRPRVADYLGIEGAVGLTDVLIGIAEVEDVLQPWGNSLTVLASGATAPNPSELLGSPRMVALLAQLRKQFQIILIDTPPLLPVTDGAVTATLADGALLVVRHGSTRRNQVVEALETLRGVDARLLGTVLNMVPVKGPDAHVAYGRYGDYSTIPRMRADAVPAVAPAGKSSRKAGIGSRK